MPTLNKRLCQGALTDVKSTLYTAPSSAGAYVVLKSISICNKTAVPVNVTLQLAGTNIIYLHPVLAYDTLSIPIVDQILQASDLIEGLASVAASIDYYITGKEVTA